MEWDGERELTADEACEIIWSCGWRITNVFKTESDDMRWVALEEIWGCGHFSENGETVEVALAAAARAVYEKGKTLYCQNCDQELPGCNCTGMD